MTAAMLIFGVVIGFLLGAIVAARRKRPLETRAALRPHPAERTAAEPTLDAVIAAVRAAGLAVRITPGGFALGAAPKELRVYAGDPARVPLRDLELVDAAHEALVFDLARALVPLYGPLRLTEVNWGTFVVDGTRDTAALQEERAERIRAFAAATAASLNALPELPRLGVRP